MRLLEYDDDGEISLTQFYDDIPSYAILSHTWGLEEVTFKDITERNGMSKAGFDKIRFCGEQARRDGLQYFWVDTCCIDKSDAVELQEAINSMFRWYRNAAVCYVYLSDLSIRQHNQADPSLQSRQSTFGKSRWFTRGWTLQELIAPLSVEFFNANRERIGDKKTLERQLHDITGIAVEALRGVSLSAFSVKDRMSWAENRETSRVEDIAYCLLGIFDVSMPLIYGEGAEKAFERLKEELFKRSRKHQLDELSSVSLIPNSAKRSKTQHNDLSFSSTHPVYSESQAETRQQLDTERISSIETNIKESLIEQLYFAKIDERLTGLTGAQGTTCRWFLAKPEYLSWCDTAELLNHGGFLWIKGNPGTGKSTLMKFLFERAKFNAKGDISQIMLSFFFLARGTVEEKSTIGLYRSLLHQLFEKAIDLKDSLEWMTADGARVVQRNGWHEEALKQTLLHAIQRLGSRSLTIFIDALDECNKSQAAGLIYFFEELCDCAREAQVRLHICFSSRHYPTIIIQKGIEVTLENEIGHVNDIEQYIKSKLRLGKLKQAESLRCKILEKSSGIFLWVVLVLDILNSEYPSNSISIKKMHERLGEIPPELSALFEMILTRDGENLEQLQICLKWILFATRPLKPQELYFAVQLGVDEECSGFWDQEDIDLEQIKTFVRSSSKGLAEVTRNKTSEVQFIHESVRDFLLGKYEGQWSGTSGNLVGYSHETLRNCCLAQINASIDKDVDIPDPLPQASESRELQKTLGLKFPFLEYSLLSVLHHANSAQRNAIEQGKFLAEFPLQRWIFLNNALERFQIRRYTKSASLLYILAERNLVDLIQIHPQRRFSFNIENERYGLPMFAALSTESYAAVQTFLEAQADLQPEKPLLRDICKLYLEDGNKRNRFRRNFIFSSRRDIVSYVAELGDESILTFLCFSKELGIESKSSFRRTPLTLIAEHGREQTLRLLLENGADLEVKDDRGRTTLSWAAEKKHEMVVKLLIEKGANIEAKDTNGRTPLSWAVMTNSKNVVDLLLENRADIEAKDNSGRTPLSWAVLSGSETIIKLLLEKGAEVNIKDKHGRTPLSWAAEDKPESVVKLLLQYKAKLEDRDELGRTPLSWAVLGGSETIIKLLLENGAELEIKDRNGRTPLSLAAEKQSEAVVKLLLQYRAKLEDRDVFGRTPLSWAVTGGPETIIKILLERGANLEARDHNGRTPLSRAVDGNPALRDYQMQLMLLEQQNKKRLMMARQEQDKMILVADQEEGNEVVESSAQPCQKAVGDSGPLNFQDFEIQPKRNFVIELLLDKGANIEAKDETGRTPLSWAIERQNKAAVNLLLGRGARLETEDKVRLEVWESLDSSLLARKVLEGPER